MGRHNGSVLGVTKIVDNGPDGYRFTIHLLPDGYTAAEMSKWHADAQNFVDALRGTAPFSDYELTCAVNVNRFDVVSDESGADIRECDDGTGDGSKVKTYFDAEFCADGENQRTMAVDTGTVLRTVNDQGLYAWHAILAIVNSPISGGSTYGNIGIHSTDEGWEHGAIHELGHAGFNLADEYDSYSGCDSGETGHDRYEGPEPHEVNITATWFSLKWGALVDPATPVPTTNNPDPDCSTCDTRETSPESPGTVGAFEGAGYFHCGLYRPEFECKMRNSSAGVHFCAACQQAIRAGLDYLAPPTVINLLTPSLAFTDVEAGTTTARAVAFEVDTCRDVFFSIDDGPARLDGGPAEINGLPVLDTPLSTRFRSDGPGPRTAYVWITYQATNAGDTLLGYVTVECELTGEIFGAWITANTVARKTVGVMLSLDKSNSMLGPAAGGGTKGDALRDAAEVFVDVIPDDDGVGVNTFATDAFSGASVQDAGIGVFGAGRIAARDEIRDYEPVTPADPDGMTSIGDAIATSDGALPTSSYDNVAMVIFTDGMENRPSFISEVTPLVSATARIFAIGLGTPENLDPASLATLCSGNDGALLLSAGGGDTFFLLTKFYLQILAGLTNSEIVYDPVGQLPPNGQHIEVPFVLTETDTGADVILVTPVPGAVLYTIKTPAGDTITPITPVPGGRFVPGASNAYYRLSLPTLVQTHQAWEGTWRAVLRLNLKAWEAGDNYPKLYRYLSDHPAAAANGLPYSLQVHARSNLKLVASCTQDSYEPGAQLRIRGLLSEYGIPVDGRATVRAELTRPDGTQATLGMSEIEPGVFETVEVALQTGVFTFRVVATGETLRGTAFTREQLVTGFAYHGGDTPPSHGGRDNGDLCCSLLECLVGAVTPEGWRRLPVDRDRLIRCVRRQCQHARPTTAEIPVDIDPGSIKW